MLSMAVGVRRPIEVDDFVAALGAVDVATALVIEGEPGIGKTTVWQSACRDAADGGVHVLASRPGPAEVSLAFTALTDLLADVDPELLEGLPEVQADALNAILLRGTAPQWPADERVVGSAVLSVLERLADRGALLIAIDDVQWLDASSRAVLSFVVRRVSGRIGVLATLRTDDEHAHAGDWLRTQQTTVVRIRLQPMALGPLTAVVSARLGGSLPRPTMVRIAEVSGGNPFYALELARMVGLDDRGLRAGLPNSLVAVVRARVAHVTDDARRVLLVAASTTHASVDLLAAACGISTADVVELLESAERTGIVGIDDGRVEFTHPLLSTGVYADASRPERRAVHRRLADLVDQPELRARHLALAATSNDTATLAALDAAAEVTRTRGAPAAGAELTELAIGLGGDLPARRLTAAEQHFQAGDLARARAHLDHVIPILGSGPLKCRALLILAALEGQTVSVAAAVRSLTAALDEADSAALRLRVLLLLAPFEVLAGEFAHAFAHAGEAVAVADELGSGAPRSEALTVRSFTGFLHGRGLDRDAMATAVACEDPDLNAPASSHASLIAAVTAAWEGRLEQACAALTEMIGRLADRGTEVGVLYASGHAVSANVWAGRWDEARRLADSALLRARAMGGALAESFALGGAALVAAHQGRVDDARAAATEAVATAGRLGSWYATIAPTGSLGFIEVSRTDYAAALEVMRPLLDKFDPARGTELVTGGFLPDAVEALCALGRVGEAVPLVEALQDNGIRLDRPWMLAAAARGRAMCRSATGDLDGALDAARQALEFHDRLPMPFERARTVLLLGQLQRRCRQKASAAASLDEARCTFVALGAPLWTARVDAERQRVTVGASTPAVLTPTEAHIAELVAAGLTNRDIAGRLFISVKTVEAAVSRVYRKLGIRNRAELASRLTELR